MARPTGIKIIAANRKARHFYELLEFIEAGIVLTDSEVKSLREGRVNFMDGYARIYHLRPADGLPFPARSRRYDAERKNCSYLVLTCAS